MPVSALLARSPVARRVTLCPVGLTISSVTRPPPRIRRRRLRGRGGGSRVSQGRAQSSIVLGCAPPSTRRAIGSMSSSVVTASRRSSSVAPSSL